MSLLLRRISKLSLSKKPNSSCFSTAITSRSKPYLLLGTEIKENVLNFNIYDPTGNKEVFKNIKIQDQSQTLSNLFQESWTIGSSRDYLALRNRKDSSVYLVDISNQLKPKIISLPPLNIDNYEEHVNVSVSSPFNGDVIVAVKFCGSRLNLCRDGDSDWTRIDVPCPSFEYSSLIYSVRDDRFYLNNCNPNYTGPFDFTPKSGLVTPPLSGYLSFPIKNIAELAEDSVYFPLSHMDDFEKGHSGYKVQQQLVESPSGQSFIVYRFISCLNEKGEIVVYHHQKSKDITTEVTEEIVVFKQDEEEEIGPYTNDIGDLCIFIGTNEAFCVYASDYPGLKPNSVYFAGHGSDFGVCDLSHQSILHFSDKSTPQPHGPICWIPPSLIP